jgi:hypothetical protein
LRGPVGISSLQGGEDVKTSTCFRPPVLGRSHLGRIREAALSLLLTRLQSADAGTRLCSAT